MTDHRCRLGRHDPFPIDWGVVRCRRCARIGHYYPWSDRPVWNDAPDAALRGDNP